MAYDWDYRLIIKRTCLQLTKPILFANPYTSVTLRLLHAAQPQPDGCCPTVPPSCMHHRPAAECSPFCLYASLRDKSYG